MQNKKREGEKSPKRGQFRGTSSRLGQSRGQMQLSFEMIFSIILIVVFLGFAFYAIKTFLAFQDSAKAGKFFDEVQSDIDRVWRSSQSSEQQEYIVPSNADFVCFVDFSSDAKGGYSSFYFELEGADGDENLVFYPVEFTDFGSKGINHIDIEKTTNEENPLCIKTSNSKAALTLKKDFGEALVTIDK